jgi:hypothetical protein
MKLEMLGRDEARIEATKEVVALARGMIAGTVGLIEGARELSRLGGWIVPDTRTDQGFRIFLGFDSETDHLPMGKVRQHWDPSSLERLDREAAEYERRWGQRLRSACSSLVARFGAA